MTRQRFTPEHLISPEDFVVLWRVAGAARVVDDAPQSPPPRDNVISNDAALFEHKEMSQAPL